MPETFREKISRVLRDFQGYAGDGQGGVGDLPVGDRSTAQRPVYKRDLREMFNDYADVADDAQAASESAADSAIQAALYDPTVRYKDTAELIASTRTAKGEGTVWQAGAFLYEEVTTGEDLTNAAGVKMRVLGTSYSLDAFPTPEAAILAASQNGVAAKGTPGKTYVFESGVTLTAGIDLDFRGCAVLRGLGVADNQPLVDVHLPASANSYDEADAVSAYSLQLYDYGNGATHVPRLTVANAADYSVGDYVRAISSERIVSIAPWEDTRQGNIGVVGHVDVANDHIYLIAPFSEEGWTPEKLVRMSRDKVNIIGGAHYDYPGYPDTRNAPYFRVKGAAYPVISPEKIADTASTQIFTHGCYCPKSERVVHERPRHKSARSAYAYGWKSSGDFNPIQRDAFGDGCRHVFDTGGGVIADADIGAADVFRFGGVLHARVYNAVGINSLNAVVCDHPDAYDSQFYNCSNIYSNRRADGATLWAIELRGRCAKVFGGSFSALSPIRIEPSTDAPMELHGVHASKFAATDADAALDPLMVCEGGGLASGVARVIMTGANLFQKRGRKEVILLNNTHLEFDGRVKYDASLSKPLIVRGDGTSKMTYGDCVFDFSGATDVDPMISEIEAAGGVVRGPGRVEVKNSQVAGSLIILTSFNNVAGSARFDDVHVDGSLFGGDGWREDGSATDKRAVIWRSDTGAPRNVISVNFSSGAGAKAITWPDGLGDAVIYVNVNTTTSSTTVGAIPDGTFPGQLVAITIVGTFSSEVNNIPANVSVAATRTIAAGGNFWLKWDGTNWTG